MRHARTMRAPLCTVHGRGAAGAAQGAARCDALVWGAPAALASCPVLCVVPILLPSVPLHPPSAQAFDQYDTDCSGTMECAELNHLCSDLGQNFDNDEILEAFKGLDEDGSGKIEFGEFMRWWLA